MQKQNDTKFILGVTAKLLIISTVTALLLSCVNALTENKIAENAQKEKNEAIAAIFPDATASELYGEPIEGVTELYMVFADDAALGYAAQVAPLGFGGEMTVMVGVTTDGDVAGVKLISHSETPGLGNRVGEADYLSQYIGKDPRSLAEGIDVITGSTISSKAILAGVESALAAFGTVFSENDTAVGGAQ